MSGQREATEDAREAIVEALRVHLPLRKSLDEIAESIVAALGLTPEFHEADDGAGGSWISNDGQTRGGSSTSPTRSRRFVTAWEVVRPRVTTKWSSGDPAAVRAALLGES